jgi:1-acyl-sn-glycerol-3-phosphate acyltransferase
MKPFYAFCRFFTFWSSVLWFRARAYGQRNVPRTGGALLVSNHQSFMDPPLVGSFLPRECHYMARDTLFRNRAFARLIRSVNAFPVKRGEADIGAIKQTLRLLKQGHLVVMFPEGTRTRDGHIGMIHPGLEAVARKAGVPVIPTLIDGVFQVWPRTQLLPGIGDVIIRYSTPIHPADYADMTAGELIELMRKRWLKMQHELYSRFPERRLK